MTSWHNYGVVTISTESEFGEVRSESNLGTHGIDFVAAEQFWLDADVLKLPARIVDETRFLVVGKFGHEHWSAVTTYRGDMRRITSVRRTRTSEMEVYEGE